MQKRKELYHNKIEYAELNKLVTKKQREDIWNYTMLKIQ